jgi:choice-of-anchor A domain-containing protein
MTHRYTLAAVTALLGTAVATPAQAVVSAGNGLQAMRELNLIVFDDLSSGHDIEGKAFVGGNMSGNSTPIAIGNALQGAAVSNRRSLTVGGNVTAGVTINNGSNGGVGSVATVPGILVGGNLAAADFNVGGTAIDIGGNYSNGNVNLTDGQIVNVGGTISANVSGGNNSQIVNAGGSINGNANGAIYTANKGIGWNAATTSIAVAAERIALRDDLQALSATLRDLANTSNFTATGFKNPIINGVDGGNGFAVLNLSSDFFTTYTDDLTYNLPSTTLPLIVNVSGTGTINWGLNPGAGNSAYNQSVIWNFFEATTVNFATMVHGSVLAPYALISNVTPIEGSVVARAFNQGGEVHLGTYKLGEPFLTTPQVAPIPEPGSWALMIMGFGLVGAAARRRKALVAA